MIGYVEVKLDVFDQVERMVEELREEAVGIERLRLGYRAWWKVVGTLPTPVRPDPMVRHQLFGCDVEIVYDEAEFLDVVVAKDAEVRELATA